MEKMQTYFSLESSLSLANRALAGTQVAPTGSLQPLGLVTGPFDKTNGLLVPHHFPGKTLPLLPSDKASTSPSNAPFIDDLNKRCGQRTRVPISRRRDDGVLDAPCAQERILHAKTARSITSAEQTWRASSRLPMPWSPTESTRRATGSGSQDRSLAPSYP